MSERIHPQTIAAAEYHSRPGMNTTVGQTQSRARPLRAVVAEPRSRSSDKSPGDNILNTDAAPAVRNVYGDAIPSEVLSSNKYGRNTLTAHAPVFKNYMKTQDGHHQNDSAAPVSSYTLNMAELVRKVNTLASQNKEAENSISILMERNRELQEYSDSLSAKHVALQESSKNRIAQLKSVNDQLANQSSTLNVQIACRDAQIGALTAQLSKCDEYDSILAQLINAEENVQSLEQEIKADRVTVNKLNKVEVENTRLELEIAKLRDQLTAERKRTADQRTYINYLTNGDDI